MTELKLVWPVNMTGHLKKTILSPDQGYQLTLNFRTDAFSTPGTQGHICGTVVTGRV